MSASSSTSRRFARISDRARSMSELLGRFAIEKVTDDDRNIGVLSSSTDLFFFFRHSFVRCVRISNRNALLELSRAFSRALQGYVELLLAKLPKDIESKKTVTDDDLNVSSLVLNTADYCYRTSQQLQEKIREKIDPAFADAVAFEKECDLCIK